MVHFACMGKLVQDDVVHEVWRKQHEVARQVDTSRGGTAAPTALASGYLYLFILETVAIGQLVQQRRKVSLGTFLQGSDDGVSEQFLYGLIGEVGLRRAEDGDAFLVGAYDEILELPLL